VPTTRHLRHATVAATAVSTAATWAIVTHVAGVQLGVRFPHSAPTTVGLGTVLAAASIATLLGWASLAILEKRLTHSRKVWVLAAVVVFLASLSLPLAFATTTSAVIGLATIHLTVAAIAVTGLAWVAPRAHLTPAASVGARSAARPLA
jgi:hypothetical protein